MSRILEQVVEAPQRSPPVLEGSARFAFYQESSYSLCTHEASAATVILDVDSGQTSKLPAGGKAYAWVEPSTKIIWQKPGEKVSELWISDARDTQSSHKLGTCPNDTVLFQAVELPQGDLGVLLYSHRIAGSSEGCPRSSARVFSDLPCMTFDEGIGRAEYTLLYLRVTADTLQNVPLIGEPLDVLSGTDLEFFPYSGGMPNISTPNCALSTSGISFVAQNAATKLAKGFCSETYFVPLPAKESSSFKPPIHLQTIGCTGWSALPVFSPDGRQLAFLRDESEKHICITRRIFVVHSLDQDPTPQPLVAIDDSGEESPLYPEWLQWGSDSKTLYFQACDTGRARIFSIPSTSTKPCIPIRVAPIEGRTGSVLAASFKGAPDTAGKCILVETSFTSPNRLFTLDLTNSAFKEVPDQKIPEYGLKPEQVSEIWIEHDDHKIHTFIMRPLNFDPTKKHPAALVIHGGPIAAWLDAFHLYWTLPIFAEADYVLVLPNYIGSAGFSRSFRLRAYGDFIRPAYHDLEAVMSYIASNINYIDPTRAISLGGSYGAYMNLFIAGQPLATSFRALISHASGGFGNTSFYATDIPEWYPLLLHSPSESFDISNVERTMLRSDPAVYAGNWKIPMLFTHGERDNRCPVGNAVAAFGHARNLGVESRLVVFPDESHFVLGPENAMCWHKEIIGWMDKYCK